jgi:hypothetical protein
MKQNGTRSWLYIKKINASKQKTIIYQIGKFLVNITHFTIKRIKGSVALEWQYFLT